MNKKRLLVIGLVGLTLASMLVLSVGSAFAQDDTLPDDHDHDHDCDCGGDCDGGEGHGEGGGEGIGEGRGGGEGVGAGRGDGGGKGVGRSGGRGTFGSAAGTGVGANGQGNSENANGQGTGAWRDPLPPATPGELPSDVEDALIEAMNDEQHAYAVYEMVMDQFGTIAPFARIQAAEAQHMAALEALFERYDIEVPEAPEFEPLVVDSVAEACAVGVEAEIANAELYVQLLEAAQDYPDITMVFTRLSDASWYDHLPAFERCAQ